MKFLDPNKPIATCISETCDNCTVSNALHCHFTLRDLIHFLLIVFPCFLLGGAGIYHISRWMLIPWLILIIGYFGFVERKKIVGKANAVVISLDHDNYYKPRWDRFFYKLD